jgi:hypothetical protein
MAARITNGDIIKNTAPNKTKIGIIAIFVIIGTFGSFRLITDGSSSQFAFWITVLALCGLLVMFFGDIVDSFDFWSLKVKMRNVEMAKREVEELAYQTVRLILISREHVITMGVTEDDEAEFREVARAILKRAGIEESNDIFQKIEGESRTTVEAARI